MILLRTLAMKKLILTLLASAVLLPVGFAAIPFEGRVTFKMTSPGAPSQQMRYAIKSDRVRIELPDQKEMGGMIVDTTKQEVTVLMDAQRMYMVMPMPQPAERSANARQATEPKLEQTGETEKIHGYTAEKYVSTHDGTKTELWLAEGLGTFAAFNKPGPMGGRGRGSAMPQGWERALAGKPLFPLRVVGYDDAGKESFRMEATSIDRQALPDGMFTPPPEYRKMDMGGMMRGMMPGSPKR